ncbi:hypothetical protein [Marivita sp.]|uniref:hypothetical protein n=1 Tax=Marivita sp. TaxID=2003365 RepID=UPI0025C3F9AF|nr:hypothetical protein [Marivita sp.]
MNVGDLIKHGSMKHWTLDGPNRLVKVVSPTSDRAVQQYGSALGYVTQEKYLYGKVANEIERLLGLRPHELRQMAYVYALERLPTAEEVGFRLNCAFPDGRVFDAAGVTGMMAAREAYSDHRDVYERSMTPVSQFYQPGSGMVPQWELTSPVPVAGKIATVTDVFAFPRANGSIKPYTPHNRGAIR